MITALISTLTGLVSGTVPNLLKEWGASHAHNCVVKMLRFFDLISCMTFNLLNTGTQTKEVDL